MSVDVKKISEHALLNVRVPMRDGVALSTNVFFPGGSGPFPVILVRTPYDASRIQADEWTAQGYVVVCQDVRGRFRSEGEDIPWMGEKEDAEDTLNWMAGQPWCDGNAGMYGGSYPGFTQIAAARSGHPALKVITPTLIGADPYPTAYRGGALRHGMSRWLLRAAPDFDQQSLVQHLPLSTLDMFVRGKKIPYGHDILAHPVYDDFWKKQSLSEDHGKLQSPAFIRTGWFDLFIGDAFDLYNGFREKAGSETARRHTRMIVGPWPHDINKTNFSDVDFGEEGKIPDLFEQELAYMARFLKKDASNEISHAPIRLFIMGTNEWRDEYEWPLARTIWTDVFLADNSRLATQPNGEPDTFEYDPANPVPTHGGAWSFDNIGPHNQNEIEARPDVLVYTSEPLTEDTEVTGIVSVKLFASSSAKDTDFTAKLVDVQTDGKPMSVTDGIVRARYRNGREELLTPDEVNEYTIVCNPTAYVFKKGHRLRLQISSSNFPAFARNLNTGGDIATETEMLVARQTIFHSAEYPSRLVLPTIKN